MFYIYIYWLWARLQTFNHIETNSLKRTVQSSSFLSLLGFQYLKREVIYSRAPDIHLEPLLWAGQWLNPPQDSDLHLCLTLFGFMCLKSCRSNLILDTPDCFLPVGFTPVECWRGILSVSPGEWFFPGGSHHPSKWRFRQKEASHWGHVYEICLAAVAWGCRCRFRKPSCS